MVDEIATNNNKVAKLASHRMITKIPLCYHYFVVVVVIVVVVFVVVAVEIMASVR